MGAEQTPSDDRIDLPTDFAEHVAAASGLDEPPATLAAWWRTLIDDYAESGETIGLDDLYSEEPTRHEVRANGRVNYAYCALDALTAAVLEDDARVTVRSIDPVSAAPVTVTVDRDAVAVSPEDALLCFGSNADEAAVRAAGSFAEWTMEADHSTVEAAVCAHTNAFESETTYERWASRTESVTAPIPPAAAVERIREFLADLR